MDDVVAALLDCVTEGEDGLASLLAAAREIGMEWIEIETDLASIVRERLYMWLVGTVDPNLNFVERRHAVRRRLDSLLPGRPSKQLAELAQQVTRAQAAVAEADRVKKEGLSSIQYEVVQSLLEEQGFRCAVCGVPVSERARRQSDRFAGGIEPVLPPNLDHVLPYYLKGNYKNRQILCAACNIVKHDYIGVQEDGVVLCGNHVRRRRVEAVWRRMAFW